MIGVKVDKNQSQTTVQKKSNAAIKTLASAPVAQLCGCGEKDDKSKTEQDGSTAFANRNSFWSPETIQGKFEGGGKQLKSAPSFPTIQLKNTTGLPDKVKTNTEKLSGGTSLSDVKVHYNSDKPAQLHAHAYAQGTDIHVAPGQEKHVPHEAWHVVQQKQGRVKATTQMKGKIPINDDAGLEKEADEMGAKAVQMASMEEELPVQQKAISNHGSVVQLGAWNRFLNFFGMGKKEEDPKTRPRSNAITEMPEMEEVKTRPRSNAITEMPEMEEVKTRPRSNAVTEMPEMEEVKTRARSNAIGNEGMLTEDDLKGLKNLRKGINEKHNILKFNFAGSGEKSWKTHKEKYQKEGLDRGTKDEKIAKREKYIKEKEATDLAANKTVVEYAGPIAKDFGVAKGLSDSGENSTKKNLEDAKSEFKKAYERISTIQDSTIEVNIKGFSRGAATATTFAKWIKSEYGSKVEVNLVAIDPVHGSGTWDEGKGTTLGKDMALMDSSADLETIDNSTYVCPIQSGHTWLGSAFTPQKLSNYTRILILYGPKAKHSWGMGGNTGSTLTWNGKPIKGMKLGTLPPGLLVADSTDPNNMVIEHITSIGQWNALKPRIRAYSKESRDIVIENAIDYFVQTKKVKIEEVKAPSIIDESIKDKSFIHRTGKEMIKMGGMFGSGGISAAVPVAKHFATDAMQLGTGLSTGITATGGALGGVAGIIGAYSNSKEMLSNGVDKNTKLTTGANVVSSLAGGVSSFGSLMGNVSNQASAALSNPSMEVVKDAAANQAATIGGILGIITGSIDIIKGALEFRVAGNRKGASDNKLKEILNHIILFNEHHDIPKPPISIDIIVDNGMYDEIHNILDNYCKIAPPEGRAAEFKSLTSLASHLSEKQSRIRTEAGLTMGKGAMAVAGGAILVALGSNPIGWGLLGAAAVVGIGILIYKHIKKGEARREIALREMNIVNEQAEYERKRADIIGYSARWNKEAKLKKMQDEKVDGPSPLEEKLRDLSKKDVEEWYSEYVNLTAAKIHNEHYGVDTTKFMYDKSYKSILINLGFKTKDEIDQEYENKETKPYPSVKQIAKAIAK